MSMVWFHFYSKPDMNMVPVVREMFLSVVKLKYWKYISSGLIPKQSKAALLLVGFILFSKDKREFCFCSEFVFFNLVVLSAK